MVHTLLLFCIIAFAFLCTGGLCALLKETVQSLWTVDEFTGTFWKVLGNLSKIFVVIAVLLLYVILVLAIILLISAI